MVVLIVFIGFLVFIINLFIDQRQTDLEKAYKYFINKTFEFPVSISSSLFVEREREINF